MNSFIQKIEQNLADFSSLKEEKAVVFGNLFTKDEAKVSFFVEEIRQTAYLLSLQTQVEYAEVYSKKLLDQLDALQKAVKRIPKKEQKALFVSSYRFPRNVHSLPIEKRLIEYRKALRALNEKISWLLDKQFYAQMPEEKLFYQRQIQETEFRKLKCLEAIEKLEEG